MHRRHARSPRAERAFKPNDRRRARHAPRSTRPRDHRSDHGDATGASVRRRRRENRGPHVARVDGQNRVRGSGRRPLAALAARTTRTRAGKCRVSVEIARPAARQATRVGWTRTRPRRALHGRAGRDPSQSGHPRLLSPPGRGRETEETGAHGLYEEAPHDSQRDDADQHDVAADQAISVRFTFKTVAIVTRWHSHRQLC
jgi:hypothetical protein